MNIPIKTHKVRGHVKGTGQAVGAHYVAINLKHQKSYTYAKQHKHQIHFEFSATSLLLIYNVLRKQTMNALKKTLGKKE